MDIYSTPMRKPLSAVNVYKAGSVFNRAHGRAPVCLFRQVAAGTDSGEVVLVDISAGTLQLVQRFRVDAGPVTALAARLSAQQLYAAATAEGPRGLDGGSVVDGPMGLPWRLPPYSGVEEGGQAKGEPGGWL